MKEPLFNTTCYDDDILDPKGGSRMALYYIKDMPDMQPGEKRRCQLFDCGYRITRALMDYKYWNQCTYEDVDYKNWIKYYTDYEPDPQKIVPVERIFRDVFYYIVKHWPEMFYYAEISRHNNGFHYIFYFDTERTRENWIKCKNISHSIVKQAFINCGYGDIINLKKGECWNDVFDDCTSSVYQLCYITKNYAWMNHLCTGEMKEYNDLVIESIEKQEKARYVSNCDEYIINVVKTPLPDDVKTDYIDHYQRWTLYISLRRLFTDTYENEYDYCCEHIPEQEGHSVNWYKSRKEGTSWDRDYHGDEYIDTDLLKKFGYTVTFTKKTNKKGNIDFINLLKI